MIDDALGEIRATSATVQYDGSIVVLLDVPGADESVEHTIEGDTWTVQLCYHGATLPIDMGGKTATDRRVLELVTRGVRKLNEQMARQAERLGRQRREWPDDD